MKLKKVYSKYIPIKGYIALAFYPWVFIRKEYRSVYTPKIERHETTHALQQKETLWIGFFILYVLEYLVKLMRTFSHKKAYRSISFEQEAYENEVEIGYNNARYHYAWVKYIFTLREE